MRKNVYLKKFGLLCATAVTSSSFCMDQNGEFERTFEGNIEFIRMYSDSGKINITTGVDGTAKIHGIPLSPNCNVTTNLNYNTLEIDNRKISGGGICNFDIVVPKKVNVSMNIGDSDINVDGTSGGLEIDAGSCRLSAKGIGSLRLKSGKTDACVSDVGGDSIVNVGSGKLNMVFGSMVTKVRNIDVSGGDLNLEVTFPTEAAVKSNPDKSTFPFISSFNSNFALTDYNYNFYLKWGFGKGGVTLKKT